MKIVISVGGRFHAFNLAAELERQGHLRRLITSYPSFAVRRWGIPASKISPVWGKELISRLWRRLPAAWRRRSDPDFWLAENFDRRAARRIPSDTDIFVGWSYFSLYALRKAKALGILTVLDHGSSHIEYQRDILNEEYARWGLPAPIMDDRPVRKELEEYETADYIALSSRFAMRTFIEKGVPEAKLLCVPYGVDLGSFHPASKHDDVFRVVFAGGLTLRKGVHYLLEAFAALGIPGSELLLIGTIHDEIRPFLEKYGAAAQAAGARVRAIGSIPQAELASHYSQSSVFVLDSVEDGFGMVIIQAMACGLPVIASENTGGPDIVRDGQDGFIIPIRDPQTLKEKLKYLHEHPEARLKMGAAAAGRVAEGFTWEDYGRRMGGEYRRILHRP